MFYLISIYAYSCLFIIYNKSIFTSINIKFQIQCCLQWWNDFFFFNIFKTLFHNFYFHVPLVSHDPVWLGFVGSNVARMKVPIKLKGWKHPTKKLVLFEKLTYYLNLTTYFNNNINNSVVNWRQIYYVRYIYTISVRQLILLVLGPSRTVFPNVEPTLHRGTFWLLRGAIQK